MTNAVRPGWWGWFAAVLCFGALLGCASMSEGECKTADWHRKGVADGSAGLAETWLAHHHDACAKVGVAPDAAAWRRGWDEGLRSYCVPAVGWRQGLAGAGYGGVCRGPNEEGFVRAWRAGSEVHRAESQLASNAREIERLESQLAKSQNADERRNLRERLRLLDIEQSQLRQRSSQLRLNAP